MQLLLVCALVLLIRSHLVASQDSRITVTPNTNHLIPVNSDDNFSYSCSVSGNRQAIWEINNRQISGQDARDTFAGIGVEVTGPLGGSTTELTFTPLGRQTYLALNQTSIPVRCTAFDNDRPVTEFGETLQVIIYDIPEGPINLQFNPDPDRLSQLTLSWDTPPNTPTGVNVSYIVTISGPRVNINQTVTDTFYQFDDLTSQTCEEHTFSVQAVNPAGPGIMEMMEETIPIFTTDVQRITVATLKEMKSPDKSSVIVACNFITNSNAKGCIIHFIDNYNRTMMVVNLTRNATTNRTCALIESSEIINEVHVYGYDIEYDGSVGSLQVPGIVTVLDGVSSNSSLFLNNDCKLLNNTILSPPSSYRTLIVSLATLATMSALVVLSVILLPGAIKNKNKRKKLNRSERSENNYEQEEKENEYYVLEEVESGEVQAETQPDINNENEHHYHVLESNEHRATEIENFYHILEENEASSSSVLPPSNTKPVYFEVLDLPTTQTSKPEESSLSHFTEEHNSSSPKSPTTHVYHDICDLPQEDTAAL